MLQQHQLMKDCALVALVLGLQEHKYMSSVLGVAYVTGHKTYFYLLRFIKKKTQNSNMRVAINALFLYFCGKACILYWVNIFSS